MASYCTPSDVRGAFPSVQPNQPDSIQDTTIQTWLDDAKAEIRARFLRRGIDPDVNITSGSDQANILRKLNLESGIRDLAHVLEYTWAKGNMEGFGDGTIRSPLGAKRFSDGRFDSITKGEYDALFLAATSTPVQHLDPEPALQGVIAGGDQDPTISGASQGQDIYFSKSMWQPDGGPM